MGQASSNCNFAEGAAAEATAGPLRASGDGAVKKEPIGLAAIIKKHAGRASARWSMSSRGSQSSSGHPEHQQQLQTAAGHSGFPAADSSQTQQSSPKPAGLPNGLATDNWQSGSPSSPQGSGLEKQRPSLPGSAAAGSSSILAVQSKQPQVGSPSRLQDPAGQPKASPASYGSLTGSKGSGTSSSVPVSDLKCARASFAHDHLDIESDHHADHQQLPTVPSSYAGSQQGLGSTGGSTGSFQPLHDPGRKSASYQRCSVEQRASIDSVASKASSTGSKRSSFALEAAPDCVEMDHYGRPSFAPFEKAMASRGAVFEASLPSDLAEMYRRLAVLLPQAPIPLVTVLQLWGITDPREAQETVPIFVMQGVLKAATLPDGATWLLVSPDHQQYVLADHPTQVPEWHAAVLNIYRKQVIATRYLQQQKLLQQGGAAAAAALAMLKGLQDDEVLPSQFINDGYVWLAMTHHLMGAGLTDQVRALLVDPSWLEVKLHCYGVAAVVDDFRTYLQVNNDLTVKAVLQAFQMSLSCCMERSHLPMMRHQLVLRLMAAAQASTAADTHIRDSSDAGSARDSDSNIRRISSQRSQRANSSSDSGAGAGSGSGPAPSHKQLQQQYQSEMREWFTKQYKQCRLKASLLSLPGTQLLSYTPEQQQQLPPHLMCYTPSLRQAGGRHRMALRGHLGPIRSVVITRNGKDVLTASEDGGVQVWDMDIGDCILQLQVPQQVSTQQYPGSPAGSTGAGSGTTNPVPLTALAVTADGGCCLSGDAEGWLNCWNLKTGQLVHRVRAHRARLNALAVDSSGSRCITGGQDRTAKLWSLPAATPSVNRSTSLPGGGAGAGSPLNPVLSASGSLIGTLQLEFEMAGHGLEHADTGAVLDAVISSDGVLGVTVSDDMKVKVWDLEQQMCVQTCRGHSGWVVAAQFIGNTHTFVTASHDETARAWDAWTGECLGTLIGHSGRLNAVQASADGRVIVTVSDDMTARVWETMDFTCVGVLKGHTGWINNVALLRNGRQCVTVSGDGTARVWDTNSGKCLQILEGHSGDVTCVVLTNRGRFAVTGSVDGTAQVWDLSAQDVSSLNVHQGKVISVVACPNGSHAASVGADGCMRLWDLLTGRCISNTTAHASAVPQCLHLVKDGSKAFSGAGDRTLVAVDMQTGTSSICLPAKQGSRTRFMHVSADGSAAAVLLFDSSMAVYDTAAGDLRCHLMQRGDRDAQRVHSGGVNAVYLTADGSRAVSVSKDCTARVWDSSNGACMMVLKGHEDSIHAAVLSPDESLLATASFDCTVRLWDFATGECLRVLQHTDPVQLVAFSPPVQRTSRSSRSGATSPTALGQSTRLITGCDGRALWLWDVQSGACVAALGEHKDTVTSACFSPDGQWLASTSQDRSVLVWQAETGRLAGLYVGDAAMVCCCFGVRGSGGAASHTKSSAKSFRAGSQQQGQDGQLGNGSMADAATVGSTTAAGGLAEPGGLTLLVGSASGRVHFVDCL